MTTLEKLPKSKKRHPTWCALFPELETDLHGWVVECHQNGYVVIRTGIRLCTLQMSKEEKYRSIMPSTFVASTGWCTSFMNRNDFCLRQQTKITRKLPKDLEEKIKSFQKFITRNRKELSFEQFHELFDDSDTDSDFEGF